MRGLPQDRGDGHPALLERGARLEIRPGEELPTDAQHGLERERPLGHLHHPVGVHQRAFGAVRSADRRPLALLSMQPARMPAALLAVGDGIPERVDGAREFERLDAQDGARAGTRQIEAQESRFEVGKVHVGASPARLRGAVHDFPALPGVRCADPKALGRRAVEPVDDQAADAARPRGIDHDPRPPIIGVGSPPGSGERRLGAGTRPGAGGDRRRRQALRQILDLEIRDPERAPPALAGHDGDFDESELRDGTAAGRAPRELDLACSRSSTASSARAGADPWRHASRHCGPWDRAA